MSCSKLALKKRRQRQTREGRCRISNCDLEIVSRSRTPKYVHINGYKIKCDFYHRCTARTRSCSLQSQSTWDPEVFIIIIIIFPFWWLSFNKHSISQCVLDACDTARMPGATESPGATQFNAESSGATQFNAEFNWVASRDSVQCQCLARLSSVGLETWLYWLMRANSVWVAGDRTRIFGATHFNAHLLYMRLWA